MVNGKIRDVERWRKKDHISSGFGCRVMIAPLSLALSFIFLSFRGKKAAQQTGEGRYMKNDFHYSPLFRLLIYFFSSPPQVPPKNPSHCLSVILLSCETLSKLVGSSNIQTLDLVVFGQNDYSIALNLIRSKSKPQRNRASCWSSIHKSGQLYRDNLENLEK
jgi:hypothetical protein